MPLFRTHTYSPGGPDRASDPLARTAYGLVARDHAMRRLRHFVEERGRRRCATCVAKILLERVRR